MRGHPNSKRPELMLSKGLWYIKEIASAMEPSDVFHFKTI